MSLFTPNLKGWFDTAGVGQAYKLNGVSQVELMRLAGASVAQMAEFQALSTAGHEPDVLLGYFPIYLVGTLERGKSAVNLRFRGIGGHLMAFNRGDKNSLIIKFSLVGPLAPIYLQLLDTAYYYGAEYATTKGINTSMFPSAGTVGPMLPNSDIMMRSNRAMSVRSGEIADQGAYRTYAEKVYTKDGAVLPDDMKTTNVASGSVDLNQAEVSERTTVFDANDKQIDQDWETIAKKRTFTVITGTEIFPRMYIETILVSERRDLSLGEIEVDLLLRRYVEPAVKTRYFWEESVATSVPVDKSAIKKTEAAKKALTKKLKNPAKSKKLAALVKAGEDELKPRTRYTAGPGISKLKQVTGVDPKDVVDYDKVSLWFNMAWRAAGAARRAVGTPTQFANDPIFGRMGMACNWNAIQSGARPLSSGEARQLDVVSQSLYDGLGSKDKAGKQAIVANSVTGEGSGIPIAPHQSPSINRGDASSVTYQQGITFNSSPELVAITYNGMTGVTEYHVPLVDWRSFLHYLGEDETVDEIADVLATQSDKQADLENTIIYGCNVFKLTGSVPQDGDLEFLQPVECSFHVEINQNAAAEQFVPKMKFGDAEFTVQPGLVYYLGTAGLTSWYQDEDDGLMHVDKPILDEIYFYCKSVQMSGQDFAMVGFFFYPMLGVD